MAAIPYTKPLVGTTDSNGNLTLKFTGQANLYYLLGISGSCPGANALWVVKVANQQINAAGGTKITLGPAQMFPGEQLTIEISQAPALTAISVTLIGKASPQASDIADISSFISSGVSLTGGVPVIQV